MRVSGNLPPPSCRSLPSFIACVCHTFRLWCTTLRLCVQRLLLSAPRSRLHRVELEGYRAPWAAAIQNDILIYPSRQFYWYNISISHSFLCLNGFDSNWLLLEDFLFFRWWLKVVEIYTFVTMYLNVDCKRYKRYKIISIMFSASKHIFKSFRIS